MTDADARTKRYSDELNRLFGYSDTPVDFTPLGEHVLIDMIMRELRSKKDDSATFKVTLESKNIAIAGEVAKVAQAYLVFSQEKTDLEQMQRREHREEKKPCQPASQEELEELTKESEK